MKNYVRHDQRRFRVMDPPVGRERACPAVYHHWKCTRRSGHKGRHEAGGPRAQLYASWEED